MADRERNITKRGTGRLKLVDRLPPFLVAGNLNPFLSDGLHRSTNSLSFEAVDHSATMLDRWAT